MRKLRAYPSETSRTSPRRPSLFTSSRRMTFTIALLVRRDVRQQRHRARALDGVGDLPLVAGTTPRDAPGNDLAALGHQALESSHVLVIDEIDLLRTELADLAPPEAAPLHRLLRCRNGVLLLSYPEGAFTAPSEASPWDICAGKAGARTSNLERDVVVAAVFVTEGFGAGDGGGGTPVFFAAAEELDALR